MGWVCMKWMRVVHKEETTADMWWLQHSTSQPGNGNNAGCTKHQHLTNQSGTEARATAGRMEEEHLLGSVQAASGLEGCEGFQGFLTEQISTCRVTGDTKGRWL